MPRALFLPLVLVLALATGAVALAAGAVLGAAPSPAAGDGANDAVVRRFYVAINEAIRSGDVAPLDALLSPDFADHPAPADGIPARGAVLRAVRVLHAESPDVRVEVETVAADGDTVTVHSRLLREGIGGAPATVTAGPTAVGGRIDVFRVESGKVAEHWGIGDGGARCGDPIDQGNGLPAVGSGSFGAVLSPDGPLWAGLGETPAVRWQIPGAAVSTDLVVADGIVFAAGWDGTIRALDAATGGDRWRYPTGEYVFAPPVVGEGTVYVVASSGSVYALDAATGQERWRTRAAGAGGRGLTLADGTLYLTTGTAPAPAVANGVVYAARGEVWAVLQAFDAETGAERWRLDLADRALYAIETATFRTRWQLALEGDVVGALVLAGEAVYVADDDLARIDAATGRVRWRVEGTVKLRSSPAIGDGLVYLADADGRLRAFEAETGVERWAVDTGGAVVSSPVVADGVVYLGSRDGHLDAVDVASGIACGRIALGDILNTPAVVGGIAYVGTLDGRLSAVAVDGSP